MTALDLESARPAPPAAPRVVAVDLDGTLLPLLIDGTQALSPLSIAATHALTLIGVTTILVTGRMFRSAAHFARQLGLDGPIAAYQGALIGDVRSGRVLHHDPVPLDVAMEVLEYLEPHDCTVNLYVNDGLCVAERSEAIDRYERLSGMEAQVVGPLRDFLRGPSTKIGVSGRPGLLDELLVCIRTTFAGRVIAVKTWPFFLEIASPTATKARALQIIGDRLGFAAGDVLAFGDSYNDADMLAWAGTGVAMQGAPPDVIAVANAVCAPVEQDGFARYLMKQPWFPQGVVTP